MERMVSAKPCSPTIASWHVIEAVPGWVFQYQSAVCHATVGSCSTSHGSARRSIPSASPAAR